MTPDDLVILLADNRCKELVAALAPLPEKERKTLVGTLRERARGRSWDHNTAAFCIASVALITGVKQVARAVEFMALAHADANLVAQALHDRQPHWLPDIPGELLKEQNGRGGYAIVRALVRRGLVPAPTSPEYAKQMVYGLTPRYSWKRVEPSVLDEIRADPSLIRDEVWALFRTQEVGKTLAAHDRFLDKPWDSAKDEPHPERTWRHALVTLAAEGLIDRDELLDQTLAAFFRDFPASDVGWYVSLHTALAPSVAEIRARQGTYARLLAVEPGQPVALGLKALTQVHKAKVLDVDLLLASAGAVLQRPDKGTPVAALKLLASITGSEERVAEVVAVALDHGDVDIQERARALLLHLGKTAPTGGPRPLELSSPLPRYEPVPVVPVATPDELAELFARLIEEADDPVEVERTLDGVLRFATRPPKHSAGVLADRAQAVLAGSYVSAWSGEDVRAAMAALALVWLRKANPGRWPAGRTYKTEYERNAQGAMQARPDVRPDWTLRSLLALRFHEVGQAVHDGGGRGTLSLPTTSDGALSPGELNRRLGQLGRTDRCLPIDTGFAVLRIPPSGYDQLDLPRLHRTAKAVAEGVALLSRFSPDWALVTGHSEGHYRTDIYDKAAGWTDLGSAKGSVDDPVRAVLDTRDPLLLLGLQATDGEYANRFEQVTALWPVLLPHHPDLLAVHAHPRLNRALVKNRNGIEPLLAGLGRSRRMTSAPTCSALLLGLAAKNGGERTSAVDAVVELAQSGMLDGRELGRQLTTLLEADVIVGSRVSAGLLEASRAEPTSLKPLLDCLVTLLPALPGRRDAYQFIDLLAGLALAVGETVTLPPELAEVAASKSTASLAKACRRVPRPTG